MHVLGNVSFHFRAAGHPLIQRSLDGQAGNLAHLLKNFVSLREEFLSRLRLGDDCRREQKQQAERDQPGEKWKPIS
jgi:hypothetical protein